MIFSKKPNSTDKVACLLHFVEHTPPCHSIKNKKVNLSQKTGLEIQNKRTNLSQYIMGRGGFEPPKQVAADLQSVPFGHSGICPFTSKMQPVN